MASNPPSSSTPTGSTLGGAAATDNTLNRAVQGAHSMVDRAAEKAAPALDRVREGLSSATAAVQESLDEFQQVHQRWLETSRTCVRQHPLTSIGIAVATGLILSRLLKR